MPKTPPFRAPLGLKLTLELLNISPKPAVSPEEIKVLDESGNLLPLGERLEWAIGHLNRLIEESNEFLETSEVASHLASALAMDRNKRGYPHLFVDARGSLMLHVSYDKRRPKDKDKQRVYRKDLPKMADLRKRAKEMGVDISHLKTKRRAISDFLEEIESRKRKSAKVAKKAARKAASPAVEEDPGPDEITVSAPKEAPKPPRLSKGFTKTAPALAGPKLTTPGVKRPETAQKSSGSADLDQLMQDSGDVDLDELLGS